MTSWYTPKWLTIVLESLLISKGVYFKIVDYGEMFDLFMVSPYPEDSLVMCLYDLARILASFGINIDYSELYKL